MLQSHSRNALQLSCSIPIQGTLYNPVATVASFIMVAMLFFMKVLVSAAVCVTMVTTTVEGTGPVKRQYNGFFRVIGNWHRHKVDTSNRSRFRPLIPPTTAGTQTG